MESGAPGDRSFTVLTGMLALGLVVAVGLVLLLTKIPEQSAQLRLVGPTPTACPTGYHTPVCYGAQVMNIGTAATNVRCQVAGGAGSVATFGNKLPEYVSAAPVDAGASLPLTIKVEPDPSGTVTIPQLACSVTQ